MGFLIFLAALLILVLAFSLYCYKVCFHSVGKPGSINSFMPKGAQYEPLKEKMMASAKKMEDTPCETVTISGHKGTKLHGRYYHIGDDAPVMIIFHGYRGIAFRDCAGGFALALKIGFNVLAVDQRSHGNSEGHAISFGVLERHDCCLWANYIADRFPESPIVLCGVSMGAATVLMASDLPLPDTVAGIMADCPYDSPMGIISKVSCDMGYPKIFAIPLIWLGGRLFAGFNVNEASAIQSVAQAKVPILLIHGEDDHFVPCQMSRNIQSVSPDHAQLHTFPMAGHGLCYLVDPARYENICIAFLRGIEALQPAMEKSEYVRNNFTA